MKLTTAILALFFTSTGALAQNECLCCTEEHKLFDFWVGDWNVYDTTGKLVGENTIVAQVDHCVLREHWRGSGGSLGRSFNYYDRADSTWNQLWVDKQGNNIKLKGKGAKGKMVLSSDFWEAGPGKTVQNRISWTQLKDGSVEQRWDILDDSGNVLQNLFLGIYKKKE